MIAHLIKGMLKAWSEKNLLTALLLFSGVRSSSASSHQPRLTTTTCRITNMPTINTTSNKNTTTTPSQYHLHWFEPWPTIFILRRWKTSPFPFLLLLLLNRFQPLLPERLFLPCKVHDEFVYFLPIHLEESILFLTSQPLSAAFLNADWEKLDLETMLFWRRFIQSLKTTYRGTFIWCFISN